MMTQSDGTIGLGVIGCGSRMHTILNEIRKVTDRVQFAALYDPSESAIQWTREAFNPKAEAHASCQELILDPSVNWVFIGSWNCFHAEHAIAAFEAGKDVFCEKPLATNLSDCIAMRDAWQKSGRSFTIGFTLRYSAHYVRIRELIEAGKIGKVVSMEFNETLTFGHGGFILSDWRRHVEHAGPFLLEKCCHDIDLANWFTGSKATRVASFGGLNFFRPENAYQMERIGRHPGTGRLAYRHAFQENALDPFHADKDIVDNQVAILEFASGARATFHTNCNTAIPERRMYICGTEGTLRADVLAGSIELCRIGFNTQTENLSTAASGQHGGGDGVIARSLVDTMLAGAPARATLEDGLLAAITCIGIDDAMTSGSVVDMRPYWEQAGL